MLLKSVLTIGILFLIASPARSTIRDVDFGVFSFPWAESMHHHSSSGWLEVVPQSRIQLANGRHSFVEPGERPEGSPYLYLVSVTYGDLTGDGQEEAAVDLRYGTGGTMNWHYLYVYALLSNAPRLLAIFESGSRANGGLVKVVVENGLLVLDLNDETKRQGDCCSAGFVRIGYQWSGDRFVETGSRYYSDFAEISPSEDVYARTPRLSAALRRGRSRVQSLHPVSNVEARICASTQPSPCP